MIKVNLKSILGLAALGMTLLSNAVPTWAGRVDTPEVTVRNTGRDREARGSLVGARYSVDIQSIGCSINAGQFMYCEARDSAGNFLGCVSSEAKYIAEVQHMIDSSSLYFRVQDGSSACSIVNVLNYSSGLK